MQIIKKIPSTNFTLVDDIEHPKFIYYGKPHMIYNYSLKEYKVYTNKNYKYGTGIGYFPIKESKYTYVIRMKFRVLCTNSKGFFIVQEKDNEDYIRKGSFEDWFDREAMPKFSSQDFFEFFEYIQRGEIKAIDGYFECNLRIIKKTDNYFLKYYEEDQN